MTYADTVRRYVNASYGFSAPKSRQGSADKLPVSEWAEARRDLMTPATVAANHALYVSDTAHALREALDAFATAYPEGIGRSATDQQMIDAARALLAAIGEGEQ